MKVIAFSGGCFSGKTSAINAFKQLYINAGVEVHVLNEAVRNSTKAKNIDILRNSTNRYLCFELDVIKEKIEAEQSIEHKYPENSVVLIDRALTDSLMYYTLYIDVNKLSDENLEAYQAFREELSDAIFYSFAHIYTHVIEFSPLAIPLYKLEDAEYRPKRVDTLKYIEHSVVNELNECYYNKVLRYGHNNPQLAYIRTHVDAHTEIDKWLMKFLRNNENINFLP